MSFLQKICAELSAAGLRFAIVGGYAVALHGAPRGTIDIDMVIAWSAENLAIAERVLRGCGLVSSLPIGADDMYRNRDEYVMQKNLVAWNFHNPDRLNEQVDIIVGWHLQEDSIEYMEHGELRIPVLRRDELIRMKRQSGREQDLQDIDALQRLGR